MLSYADLKMKTFLGIPPRSIEDYPEESIKKVAVLFTDIVGSSNFFKKHGDLAGRKMLKRHQEMVSPAIVQCGGKVVKFIGDSVLAYFFDPDAALSAGIRIQKTFQSYNQGKDRDSQIHLRVCIHYGDGIVEDKDIFGDVVNMAAKFLPIVDQDQIFVSNEVFEQVCEEASVDFERIDPSEKSGFLKGITTYKVIWDRTAHTGPMEKTVLFLIPLLNQNKGGFTQLWERLIRENKRPWAGKVELEKIFSDKSIGLIAAGPSASLTLAREILSFLSSSPGIEEVPKVPVKMIIDSGAYLQGDSLVTDELKVNWELIKPGYIHISSAVNKILKDDGGYSLIPVKGSVPSQSYYRVILKDQKKDESQLFFYQDMLIRGPNPPCFYCGDQRHLTIRCPSKLLPEKTRALEKLGYLSVDEINRLFFNYLTEKKADMVSESNGSNQYLPSEIDALHGFYELRKFFQLRLLKTIWNSKADRWNRIEERRETGEKGGLIWLGQDCIRVSNLDKAESIIRGALKKDPHDYKAHCIRGFWCVEKGDFSQAEDSFEDALENAGSISQKIFALFLLCRIHELGGDFARAGIKLQKIQSLDPYCYDALYLQIIYAFRDGRDEEGLSRLTKLIKNNRIYYVYALIDPELARYNIQIHSVLKDLMDQSRLQAKKMIPEAEKEIKRMEGLFYDEDPEIKDIRSLWNKLEQLSEKESYFNHLDIIHFCHTILQTCKRVIEGRRMRLLRGLNELEPRVERGILFLNRFPHPYLIRSLSRRLNRVQSEMLFHRDVIRTDALDQLKEAYIHCEQLNSEMDQIEKELRRLDKIRRMIHTTYRYLKINLIMQLVNLVIAILFFPIITHYLTFLIPGFKIAPHNLWSYQKTIIVLGGLTAVILAFFISSRMARKR